MINCRQAADDPDVRFGLRESAFIIVRREEQPFVWKATIGALSKEAYLDCSYWEGCRMKTTSLVAAGFLAVCISLIGCEQKVDVARGVSFANDVLPILEANCIECHDIAAEGVATSGLNLRDYDGVMQGTRSGLVVVPNSSESSSLYLVVAHQTDPQIQMPPHHGDAVAEGRGPSLSENEIKTIQDWIDQGALDN